MDKCPNCDAELIEDAAICRCCGMIAPFANKKVDKNAQ
jgi:hypothetical protein